MQKQVKNALKNWTMDNNRIRGEIMVPQNLPSGPAVKGDVIVTSAIVRIFLVDGCRHAETTNSLYILMD